MFGPLRGSPRFFPAFGRNAEGREIADLAEAHDYRRALSFDGCLAESLF